MQAVVQKLFEQQTKNTTLLEGIQKTVDAQYKLDQEQAKRDKARETREKDAKNRRGADSGLALSLQKMVRQNEKDEKKKKQGLNPLDALPAAASNALAAAAAPLVKPLATVIGGALATATVLEGAKALGNKLQETLSNQTGGVAQTEKSTYFTYENIVDARNKELDFMADTGLKDKNPEMFMKRYNEYGEVLELMKQKKTLNDQLYTSNQRLAKSEEDLEKLESKSSKSGRDKQKILRLKKLIKELQQASKDLETNKSVKQTQIEREVKDLMIPDKFLNDATIDKKNNRILPRLFNVQVTEDSDGSNAIGKQRGGGVFTVPGAHGSGDKANPKTGKPYMLQPGSFVLNYKASNALRRMRGGDIPALLEGGEMVFPETTPALESLNRSIPRFQDGGLVSHPNTGEGYQPGSAKDYKNRPVVLSKAAADSFAKMMQAGGVKGSDVASSQRSKAYNSQINGAAKSNHLFGNAMDIHGTSKAWMKENSGKYGWQLLDPKYTSHDGHFDYVGGKGTTDVKEQKEIKGPDGEKNLINTALDVATGITDSIGSVLSNFLPDLSTLGIGGEMAQMFATIVASRQGLGAAVSAVPGLGLVGQGITASGTDGSGTATNDSPFKATGKWGPVLKLIAGAESGAGGYEAMYPSKTLEGATDMTISEVASKATGAVGMWQNMPRFLNERARAVGLDPNVDKYNEKNQRSIAEYLIGPGQANVTMDMAKNNPQEAMLRLSKVWAAIPKDGGGKSYYANDGVNKAHITPQQMMGAFEQLQLQSGGLVPAKLEGGEMVFPPDMVTPELSALNNSIPRFSRGGSTNVRGSRNTNRVGSVFDDVATDASMMESGKGTTIINNNVISGGGGGKSHGVNESGSEVPNLPSQPTSHIASTLMMQQYSLSRRIG